MSGSDALLMIQTFMKALHGGWPIWPSMSWRLKCFWGGCHERLPHDGHHG